nr:uncharacterized protein LOC109190215 isoform X1 [Ipomoea batatas]
MESACETRPSPTVVKLKPIEAPPETFRFEQVPHRAGGGSACEQKACRRLLPEREAAAGRIAATIYCCSCVSQLGILPEMVGK